MQMAVRGEEVYLVPCRSARLCSFLREQWFTRQVCLSHAGSGRDGEPKIRFIKGKKRVRGAPVAYGLDISVPSSGNFLGSQQRRSRDLDSRPNAGTVPGLSAGAPLLNAQDSHSTLCRIPPFRIAEQRLLWALGFFIATFYSLYIHSYILFTNRDLMRSQEKIPHPHGLYAFPSPDAMQN